ncbi:B12-binding domain-containing radical SAM protein [Clostridium gasigenes]|uniref:B12-binding domain-containing radical SAM protein n=1 Tax=Clostridium gasigenes TaxID=94869 RepID=UPI001C0DE8EB|nr:radical SAM protein [Clostridium gasigenes]MBU3089193.1 B12-binding domain-containing radical SAM protein [Clostridium gasigenes]
MNNIILLNLPIKKQFEKYIQEEAEYNPSLGLLAISSFLKMHGYNVIIKDFNYEMYSIDIVMNTIEEIDPLLVGITAFTENVYEVINISKQIKKLRDDIKIIVGGPHATLRPEDLIKSNYIDYVSMKEGESTFIELLEYLISDGKSISLDMIDGLIYKKDNIPVKNRHRGHIGDLNLIPVINRSIIGIEKYKGTVNVSTSRGCPANCIYCAATVLSGACYRTRDVGGVFLEMLLLKYQLGIRLETIYFVDDTFTADIERVMQFLAYMKKSKVGIKWACESRVDVMTTELIDKMVEYGCNSIQFGVESGNQEVLDKLHKNIDLKHTKNIVAYASKYEVEICLSFMFGHYCDTTETMDETLHFIEDLVIANVNVTIGVGYNTPFPGTWQFTHAERIGLCILTNDYSKYDLITPIIETENFNANDLVEVYNKAQKYCKI